jgi:hypothetical protein
MSTLRVSKVETASNTDSLTLGTGNTSGPNITISAETDTIIINGNNISGNNGLTSTGKAIAMAIVFG